MGRKRMGASVKIGCGFGSLSFGQPILGLPNPDKTMNPYTIQKRIEKNMREKQKRIDKRIGIKDRNIAYFNSLNSAIAFCQAFLKPDEVDFAKILEVKDHFYDEWEQWYEKLLNKIEEQEKINEDIFDKKLQEAEFDEAGGGFTAEELPEIEVDEINPDK